MSLSDSPDTERKVVVENVLVFNGFRFTEPQTVIIHKGITSNDPENTDETINGKGS